MGFTQEKIEELTQANLGNEVTEVLDACEDKFGVIVPEMDSILNVRVEKIERIRIKPTNPIVNPGSLLGCQEEVKHDDPFAWGSLNKACVNVDSEFGINEVRLYLDQPEFKNVESLFELSRRMKKTLLVVGDYIEIVKTTVVTNAKNANNDNSKRDVLYNITHYVEVLDAEKMYRIPTTVFGSEDEDAFVPYQLDTNKLNLHELMERYKRAKLEDVLRPLKIVS